MQDGDISSETVPRLLVEFEGILADPPKATIYYKSLKKLGKWDLVVQQWEINDLAARVIVDRSYRMHQEFEIITQQPPEFAKELAERLDYEDIPVRRVWTYKPDVLGRNLVRMPHVAAVYTPEITHVYKYGPRGRLVTADNVREIGRF